MNKRTRILLLLLAVVLAVVILPRLCADGESQLPGQSQQADLPLIGEESEAGSPQIETDLPLIEGEDAQQPGGTNLPLPTDAPEEPTPAPEEPAAIDKDGTYTEKDDVALYLYTYGRLPENFITKKQAQALGWPGGGLDDYAYGKCIGGDRFGNYEGLLPEKKGRQYYECDVGTLHKSKRGAKRIIFSSDGLIYYTNDHYESFTLLYGEEG